MSILVPKKTNPKTRPRERLAFSNHAASSSCKLWRNEMSANASTALTSTEDGLRWQNLDLLFFWGTTPPFRSALLISASSQKSLSAVSCYLFFPRGSQLSLQSATYSLRHLVFSPCPSHGCLPLQVIIYLMGPSGTMWKKWNVNFMHHIYICVTRQ